MTLQALPRNGKIRFGGIFFCIKDMGGRLDLKKNAYLCPTKKE